MHILARRTLREYWESHPDVEQSLLAWYRIVQREVWESPSEVKARFPKASIVGDNRVVFNIRGNEYRLVVHINYTYRKVYIRFVGTHEEYDRINVREV